MNIVIGIDPGVSGGITVLKDGKIDAVYPMPIFQITKGSGKSKKTKNYIDGHKLYQILEPFKKAKISLYVEDVHTLSMMSATSNFSMGHGLGCVHTAVRVLGLGFKFIQPKKWQKTVWKEEDLCHELKKMGNIEVSGKLLTKPTSFKAAKRIFPDHNWLKSKDGLFDSALIAYFGYLNETAQVL